HFKIPAGGIIAHAFLVLLEGGEKVIDVVVQFRHPGVDAQGCPCAVGVDDAHDDGDDPESNQYFSKHASILARRMPRGGPGPARIYLPGEAVLARTINSAGRRVDSV